MGYCIYVHILNMKRSYSETNLNNSLFNDRMEPTVAKKTELMDKMKKRSLKDQFLIMILSIFLKEISFRKIQIPIGTILLICTKQSGYLKKQLSFLCGCQISSKVSDDHGEVSSWLVHPAQEKRC